MTCRARGCFDSTMVFECSEGMRGGRITEQECGVDATAKHVKRKTGQEAYHESAYFGIEKSSPLKVGLGFARSSTGLIRQGSMIVRLCVERLQKDCLREITDRTAVLVERSMSPTAKIKRLGVVFIVIQRTGEIVDS